MGKGNEIHYLYLLFILSTMSKRTATTTDVRDGMERNPKRPDVTTVHERAQRQAAVREYMATHPIPTTNRPTVCNPTTNR
jgi:hypothetical protein